MRSNKKTILISWFIGVGFGLFFSGIMLSILLFASNKTLPAPIEEEGIIQNENKEEPEKPEEAEVLEVADETIEIPKETQAEEVEQVGTETIELDIKPNATGHEITQLLFEKRVISDYDGFIAHMVSQDAEHRLAHGIKTFPLNSDIETVFKILRP